MRSLENQGFLLLLVTISLAFALVIGPYYEAIVWRTVGTTVFAPLYRRLTVVSGTAEISPAISELLARSVETRAS